MAEKKVTTMVIKVDLECEKCHKKIKKVLCRIPQIQNQIYDKKAGTVTITVFCCSPEKVREKIICKGGVAVKSIEIKAPPPPAREPNSVKDQPKPKEQPKGPDKPKDPVNSKEPEKPIVVIVEPPKHKEPEPAPPAREPNSVKDQPKPNDQPKGPDKPKDPANSKEPEKPIVVIVEPPKHKEPEPAPPAREPNSVKDQPKPNDQPKGPDKPKDPVNSKEPEKPIVVIVEPPKHKEPEPAPPAREPNSVKDQPKPNDQPKGPDKPKDPANSKEPEKPIVVIVEPPKHKEPEPAPPPKALDQPLAVCPPAPAHPRTCSPEYNQWIGGWPCYHGHGRPASPTYAVHGRPVYDSWGGGGGQRTGYDLWKCEYVYEDNPSSCTIM